MDGSRFGEEVKRAFMVPGSLEMMTGTIGRDIFGEQVRRVLMANGGAISEEHARKAMEMLEKLTGGLIIKKDILFRYEQYRKKEYSRMNVLWEAFGEIVFQRYQYSRSMSLPEFDFNSVIVERVRFIDIYRKVVVSYPKAKPVKFALEVYLVEPSHGGGDFNYKVFVRNYNKKDRRIIYSSIDDDRQAYSERKGALVEGLKILIESMVVYALDKTAHVRLLTW
jgi:hypothetical protein